MSTRRLQNILKRQLLHRIEAWWRTQVVRMSSRLSANQQEKLVVQKGWGAQQITSVGRLRQRLVSN